MADQVLVDLPQTKLGVRALDDEGVDGRPAVDLGAAITVGAEDKAIAGALPHNLNRLTLAALRHGGCHDLCMRFADLPQTVGRIDQAHGNCDGLAAGDRVERDGFSHERECIGHV